MCPNRRFGRAASRFLQLCPRIPRRGIGGAARRRCRSGIDPRPRLLDHPRPQPRRRGGRTWAGLLTDEELLEGLRHMMTLRAFDARMLMAQRQGKTSFYMQHMGEEAVSCAFRKALLPGDMNFPTYRQAGPADRRRLSAGRHDVPDLLQRAGSAEGPPVAGALFLEGAWLLLDLRQSGDAVYPGRRLGHGVRDQERHARSPPAGSATARPRNRTSMPRWFSPPPTRRRWCSTSSTISGRSRPSRASRAAAPALSRRAASASASPRSGRRQRLSRRPCRGKMGSRAGAPQSRADADRTCHLSRRRAFHLR